MSQIALRRQSAAASPHSAAPLRVFVHLGHGFGATSYRQKWERGEVPGINEPLPYGYWRAAGDDCIVAYSEDARESVAVEFMRRALCRLLGFDLIHAWRNRKTASRSEVVWTFTELEYLALLMLWRSQPRDRRPKLIAQTIWLFDRWHQLSAPRRWLYRKLLDQADILTVHSPENLKVIRRLFPHLRAELVRFSINTDLVVPPELRPAHRPLRVASLGTDMHRDWSTLFAAVAGLDQFVLRVGSRAIPRSLRVRAPNVSLERPTTAGEVRSLYSWADIVVLALKPNLHGSGVTTLSEAILSGRPVVCSDTGGLRSYFSDHAVRYVRPGDALAMRRAIELLGADDHLRFAMVRNAQERVRSANLNSLAFARRHYELSRELLSCSP
jgi:glycosyltransferase involved in cell wall biosynthesis